MRVAAVVAALALALAAVAAIALFGRDEPVPEGWRCAEPWSSCSPDVRWLERVLVTLGFRDPSSTGTALSFGRSRVWTTGPDGSCGDRHTRIGGVEVCRSRGRVSWNAKGTTVWLEPSDPAPLLRSVVRATLAVPREFPARLAAPGALEPLEPRAARVCRLSQLIRRSCPERVPAGSYPRSGVVLAPIGAPGERFDLFSLTGRGERGPHFELLASRYGLGRAKAARVFADWPRSGPPVGISDGLLAVDRKRPLLLGRLRWNGRDGELVLDRPDPSGGRDGNHLVFRWQERGIDYATTLHGRKPLRRAAATLRAVVAAMPS
ncbi:MAG: hypothetical protein ACRDNB_01530 [Gaiellaceae bacterium]